MLLGFAYILCLQTALSSCDHIINWIITNLCKDENTIATIKIRNTYIDEACASKVLLCLKAFIQSTV